MKVPYPLRLLWASVPRVQCKGLCWDSCGPISASPTERALLAAHGIDIPGLDDHRERASRVIGRNPVTGEPRVLACPALTEDGRCSVYAVRPLICRMWGAIERLPCEHGCHVESAPLTDHQAWGILQQAEDL